MTTSSTDSIHKDITLRTPPSRVWRALTDSAEFGEWFGVRLEGTFRVGEIIRGRITNPGCEHMILEARVERMEPERYFAFRWHPRDIDADVDRWTQPSTLVEFRLEAAGDGTLLRVTESGFDAIPAEHRNDAFTRNEGGWAIQVENIKRHLDG